MRCRLLAVLCSGLDSGLDTGGVSFGSPEEPPHVVCRSCLSLGGPQSSTVLAPESSALPGARAGSACRDSRAGGGPDSPQSTV